MFPLLYHPAETIQPRYSPSQNQVLTALEALLVTRHEQGREGQRQIASWKTDAQGAARSVQCSQYIASWIHLSLLFVGREGDGE